MKNTTRVVALNFEFTAQGQPLEAFLDLPTGYKQIKAVKFYGTNLPSTCKIVKFQVEDDASQIQSGIQFGALQDPMRQWNEELAREVITDKARIVVSLQDTTIGFFSPYIVQVLFQIDK